MRYLLLEVEVTRPLQDIVLPADTAGIAVLLRRKDIPIGFWLERTTDVPRIDADALSQKIAREAGAKVLEEEIREEIETPRVQLELPSLTIAICTKDRTEGVERLLKSLQDQAIPLCFGTGNCEILIVDNAPSDDRTRDLAEKTPGVRYVREFPPGLNFGRNRALREAEGEILAFLDDDVIVDKHWSFGLAQAWSANRDAVGITGQVLPMELETEAQIAFEIRGGFRRGFDRLRYGPEHPGNPLYPGGAGIFGAGANMAFQTATLRKMGGFDEALDTGAAVPGGGDLDIFYRIIRAGYPLVYEPCFLVFHQHRKEMKALATQYRRSWGLGFMCYIAKCYKTDPERRINLIRLVLWWVAYGFTNFARQLKRKLFGQPHLPPSLFLGELWGGAVGLLGGYGRSKRRVAEIRARYAQP